MDLKKIRKAKENSSFLAPLLSGWDGSDSNDDQGGRMVDGDRIESWQTEPRVPASSRSQQAAAGPAQIYPGHEHNIFVKKST